MFTFIQKLLLIRLLTSSYSVLTDDSNVGVKQGISSRSTAGHYYSNPHAYSHSLPSPHQDFNAYSQISSRDSNRIPIKHTESTGINSYSSLSGSELSGPGYASSSYSQSYPSPAYPSYPSPPIPSYPVPNYGLEDNEENYEDENKFGKKHLALSISLPLILVPLAVIGILALLNFRAVFTVLVIRSLCTNDPFRTNFGQLCTFVDNISKRPSDDGFTNIRSRSRNYSKLMNLLLL